VLVALYGCEACSLTLREKCRLRMFENRVLRRIFGPKRDEVTGECRKLDNDLLNDMYSSPSNVQVIKWRVVRWAGLVACMGGEQSCIQNSGGATCGKRPLGKPGSIW